MYNPYRLVNQLPFVLITSINLFFQLPMQKLTLRFQVTSKLQETAPQQEHGILVQMNGQLEE